MTKTRALIISVGTGTKEGAEAVDSLVHGLLHSIENNGADKIFFVVTEESKVKTLPRLINADNTSYEVIVLKDADDINNIYELLLPKFELIKQQYSHVTVDFTSGTKAMTGALTILASLIEADSLSYVTGTRKNGTVIKGTEKLLTIKPYKIIHDKKYREAASFFNKYQFVAAKEIIDQVEAIMSLKEISDISILQNAVKAYSEWDKFEHKKAFDLLTKIKDFRFSHNLSFLDHMFKDDKEIHLIADLINNAQRRGEEGKFDDAVARLYRVIELMAQYRLKKYGITDTGNVTFEKIPPRLQHLFSRDKAKIQIGLDYDYKFLAELKDPLGIRQQSNTYVKSALQKRNNSILAHGLDPIDKGDYELLLKIAFDFAESLITKKEFNKFLEGSRFIKWPMSSD